MHDIKIELFLMCSPFELDYELFSVKMVSQLSLYLLLLLETRYVLNNICEVKKNEVCSKAMDISFWSL